MGECNSLENVDQSSLANPEQGRAYLKAALKLDDEQGFLSALHAVMDSLVDSVSDTSPEVSVLPTLENAKAA